MSRDKITSVAIGSFDGMHVAHQKLISQADGVVVIERNRGYLTPSFAREEYIDKPCFFYKFDEIKSLAPEAFVKRLELDFPNLQKIVVGYDFLFGKNRSGDSRSLAEIFNGDVDIVSEVEVDGVSVHSATIMELLLEGKIDEANLMLGREYIVSGNQIKGQGIGQKELVATINMQIEDYQLPKDGVYVTDTLINDKWLRSVTFIGHRITTDGKYSVESHVLDVDIKKIINPIKTKFLARIRDNKQFATMQELKEQIFHDIQVARDFRSAKNER